LTHADLLDFGIAVGAEAIQFCENLCVLDLPGDDRLELRRKADDYGIAIEVGTRGIDPDRIRRLAEFAASSGFVRVVIDDQDDEPCPRDAVMRLLDVVDAIDPVKVAIENHDRFTSAMFRAIAEESDCVIVLDTANSLTALEGVDSVVAELADLTVCFHAKDVAAKRTSDQLGLEVFGVSAGEGMVDFGGLVPQVARHGRLRSVILEHWTPPGGQGLEREWTYRGMAYLRQILR